MSGEKTHRTARAHRWTAKAIRAQAASSRGRGIAIVAVLLGVSWLVSYVLGGGGRVPPHWFYVPILLAAARFGLAGAAATSVVAGLIAGPLLPLDVSTGAQQHLLDWTARLGFFLGIGLVMGAVIVRLKSALEREITLAQKDRDLALDQGEHRTRSIIEAANEAVVGMDASGVITDWNRAAEATFGWSREEAIGRVLAETVMPERHRDGHRKGLDRFLTTGVGPVLNTRIELVALHRKGHEFPVELTISALRVGGSVSFIAFVHDITGRKRAEEALHRAKEEAERAEQEAERANQAKSDFLSRMSHELRTPLNAILGFGQLLEMDDLELRQAEYVQQILKGGKHLLDLINEVLDIARIESGRITLSLEPIALAEALDGALDLIRPLAAEDGIELKAEDSWSSDLYVWADGQRLKQVLLNLLTNAVKYNRPGGSVIVRWRELPGDGLRVEVTDEGPGIQQEMMDRLFIPFERLGADAMGIEGTGLGLALSKRLTEAMGGTLGVDSVPRRGSTFFIELPRADPPGAEEETEFAERLPTETTEANHTLLYIEDNTANLKLIEQALAFRLNLNLLSAMQGSVGLDLARQHQPDLIMLDLHLPDTSGEELLRLLKGDPRTRDIPVIVISADATPGRIRKLLAAGARDYLTKPLDMHRFFAVVKEALQGHGLDQTGSRSPPSEPYPAGQPT